MRKPALPLPEFAKPIESARTAGYRGPVGSVSKAIIDITTNAHCLAAWEERTMGTLVPLLIPMPLMTWQLMHAGLSPNQHQACTTRRNLHTTEGKHMGSTWRYVQQTRGHALETVLDLDAPILERIVSYLEKTPANQLYSTFRSIQDEAIKWLSASGSQRRRKFKSSELEVTTIAAAMWYGRLAYKTIQILETQGALSGGPGYRVTTKWAAQMACEFLDYFGGTVALMQKVIPSGSGYGEWDDMDEALLERLEKWTYNLGFIDGYEDI